jgi:hypothetical protein
MHDIRRQGTVGSVDSDRPTHERCQRKGIRVWLRAQCPAIPCILMRQLGGLAASTMPSHTMHVSEEKEESRRPSLSTFLPRLDFRSLDFRCFWVGDYMFPARDWRDRGNVRLGLDDLRLRVNCAFSGEERR